MLDSLTYSADGLIILAFIVFGVIFFLNGPHKVYESLIGTLIGIGCYLLIYQLTFLNPEFTRTLFIGNWLMDNRGMILFILKIFIAILYVMTPVTIGVNVSGELRGTGWFLMKTIFLSAFFVAFGCSIISLLLSQEGIFGSAILLTKPLNLYPYFESSQIFQYFSTHAFTILILGFALGIYKILISHWSGKLLLVGGVIYARGSDIFGKKTFDTQSSSHAGGIDDGGSDAPHGDASHDDHHH